MMAGHTKTEPGSIRAQHLRHAMLGVSGCLELVAVLFSATAMPGPVEESSAVSPALPANNRDHLDWVSEIADDVNDILRHIRAGDYSTAAMHAQELAAGLSSMVDGHQAVVEVKHSWDSARAAVCSLVYRWRLDIANPLLAAVTCARSLQDSMEKLAMLDEAAR